MEKNLQVCVARFPRETVEAAHFDVREADMPQPSEGEVLVRTAYLSLDPYMRKRLADAVAGRWKMAVGDTMMGRTVGEVVASRDPRFVPGDQVLGWGGWQQYAVESADRLERVQPVDGVPLSAHLGALGRPGITAWLGIVHVAQVGAGDRVVVSSAAGAVGSMAGQIARHLGADVVGIAGGEAKCSVVVEGLGLRACVNYKDSAFEARLRDATPQGVDVCFENVGAAVLDTTLNRMNENGRIALCGLMGQYHSGAPHGYQNFARLLDRALRLTGFRIDANVPLHARALVDLRQWTQAGVFQRWETIAHGIEHTPAAFVAMLQGQGHGKHMVKLI